jgi:hypothetical protein
LVEQYLLFICLNNCVLATDQLYRWAQVFSIEKSGTRSLSLATQFVVCSLLFKLVGNTLIGGVSAFSCVLCVVSFSVLCPVMTQLEHCVLFRDDTVSTLVVVSLQV